VGSDAASPLAGLLALGVMAGVLVAEPDGVEFDEPLPEELLPQAATDNPRTVQLSIPATARGLAIFMWVPLLGVVVGQRTVDVIRSTSSF
jgi:hypothetical protein